MSFNEEDYLNGSIKENFSYSKLPYSKIAQASFSSCNKNPGARTSYLDDDLKSGKPTEITEWRRAIIEDSKAIKNLQNLTGDVANILFQNRNIEELIESSYFPVVQLDSKGELISFTAYYPYPNVPSVPSFFWKDWLNSTYRLKGACSKNVLFIHYMVWQPLQAKRFLRLLLETCFSQFLDLENIIIVIPPHVKVPDFYREHFISVRPSDFKTLNLNSIQSLLVCLRTSVVRSLPIRIAFEEEFDAIMPFIEEHLKSSKDDENSSALDIVNFLYSKERKTLLCEHGGHLAGIMILNLKMDLDSLNEGFELSPFNGLRKRGLVDKDDVSQILDKDNKDGHFVSERSSYGLQKKSSILITSEFWFDQMNWELALSKVKNSMNRMNPSSDSILSNSESSEFSVTESSSLFDVKSSRTDSGRQSQKFNSLSHTKYDLSQKNADVKMRMRSSAGAVPRFYFPKYRGTSNAFVIDFLAIDSNAVNGKLSSHDFLEAAFKVVPDRDYCVLIIPTDLFPFPLLDLFVRVTPKVMPTVKQELYLCHKKSLSVSSMEVRMANEDDLTSINNFLKNLNECNSVYQDIVSGFSSDLEFRSFVLTVEEKIMGVSLIEIQNSADRFHLYFDVSNYAPIKFGESENQSVIKHLILNPIYHNQARFFVRDIIRLADLSCLYYVYNERNKNQCNMLTVLGDFVPIKPKRKVGMDAGTPLRFPNRGKVKGVLPFSLHLTNLRLCGFTKFHLNIVIVVVGASKTALSFLEHLIFGSSSPYVIYNNLICVTPQGLALENTTEDVWDLMFPIRDNFNSRYLSMLSLETYVSFIYGVMTEINRTEKHIVVNNKVIVKYDYLILTCGLQYLTPTPRAREPPQSRCKKFYKSTLARYLSRSESKKNSSPKQFLNMFVINSAIDAKNAFHSLQRLMHKFGDNYDKKIVIYGHNLHVFLTINTLLKLGIPGEVITFIEPFPSSSESVTVFNDYQVDQAVLDSIRNLKINYYQAYFLYDWSVSPTEDSITSVTFQSKRKQVVIPCLAFFPFVQKLVSDVTFNACSNAGLVYDGKLVINHNFKTNDNFIYAAGPFTKYSRRYFASDQDHRFFNSVEVGKKLAKIVRGKIDPLVTDETNETSEMVPKMSEPLLVCCQLPGAINLLTVRKPGKELDLETAYNFVNYGDVLTTGDCKMKKGYGYFRLHLDSEGFVEGITCFTRDEIDYMNIYSLYGLHEKLLNNLLLRYDLGLIPDFFDYFRQSWAVAIFHENFSLLRKRNREAFNKKFEKTKNDNFAEEIVKKLIRNRWRSLPESLRRKIQSQYKNSKTETEIKKNLIKFLECNRKDLPVYAIPGVVNSLQAERENSVFAKRF